VASRRVYRRQRVQAWRYPAPGKEGTLTLQVLRRAADEGLPVYLYGSTAQTVERLAASLTATVPALRIAGAEPKFRTARPGEPAGASWLDQAELDQI
jgi:UDP-N-acetyl-D-mannosaminuronic acid transferase (WecB/TagA/CpsF family)